MIFQHEEFASHMSFRLMNQHGVNDPIKLISMCPTMDLLAVCTETDSVWVARWFNSLEKIWTLPAEKHDEDKVEVLTWRPDGNSSEYLHSFEFSAKYINYELIHYQAK